MANLPKFAEVKDSIYKGLGNLNKWYGKINDTDAYFICLGKSSLHTPIFRPLGTNFFFWLITPTALDPNVKDAYAADKWDPETYVEGMAQLEDVVCTSRAHPVW